MTPPKQLPRALVAVAAIAASLAPLQASAATEYERIGGANRLQTMQQVVARQPADSEWAVLASAYDFPDALAASGVAGALKAPVVLTAGAALSPETTAALEARTTRSALVVGGEATISTTAMDSLAGLGISANRAAGANRAATSVDALRVLAALRTPDTVVVAGGTAFPDSLSVGPWAWATSSPVLLTGTDGRLTAEALNVLATLPSIKRAIIVGGTASVSPDVESQLASLDVVRLAGADRYATSSAIANWATSNGLSWNRVFVATGETYPDALAAAPLAGRSGSPILLVKNGSDANVGLIRDRAGALTVVGGPASVSDELAAKLTGATAPAPSGTGSEGSGGSSHSGGSSSDIILPELPIIELSAAQDALLVAGDDSQGDTGSDQMGYDDVEDAGTKLGGSPSTPDAETDDTDGQVFYAASNKPVARMQLVRLDDRSTTAMYDDGNLAAHGDAVAGDKIYSCRYELATTPSDDVTLSFQARSGAASSNTVEVDYYLPFTADELAAMAHVDEAISSLVDSDAYWMTSMDRRKTQAKGLLESLAKEGYIIADSICFDEVTMRYGFAYACGAIGDLECGIEDSPWWDESGEPIEGGRLDDDYYINALTAQGDGVNHGNALILNSFPNSESTPEDKAYRTDFYRDLQENWKSRGLATNLFEDNDKFEVTVDDYKRISQYNIVIIATHGSRVKVMEDGQEKIYSEIDLEEYCRPAKNEKYALMLKDHQILGGTQYSLLPRFFEKQFNNGDLNNTFIFCESCQSMGMSDTEDWKFGIAATDKGASAFVGWHNSVFAGFSRQLMAKWVDELLAGRTVGEAFDNACEAVGQNDKDWYNRKGANYNYDRDYWRDSNGMIHYYRNRPIAYPVQYAYKEKTLPTN